MNNLYAGCPIWGNRAWAGTFFPAGARQREFLALYSRRFNTVEGNTTFYAIPSPETIARWREETPPGFKFCLKFPRVISHERRLREAEAETAAFVERLAQLDDRCGPSFLQLPPSFGPGQLPTLVAYLDSLPRQFRYAVEVRHAAFFEGPAEPALDEALAARGVARVLYDVRGLRAATPASAPADVGDVREAQRRKPDLPVRLTRTAPFAFVRYISHPDLPANRPLLEEWAGRVAGWLAAGEDAFIFFHHVNDALSPFLVRDFHTLVARRHPLPPLPAWDAESSEPQQPSLL